jgi:DNA-directed RNA polymerase subunit RPC12/RpoP
MAAPASVRCPNCSAPLDVPLGEVEILCPYCASKLRFLPGREELEVVRTREEMKYRERVAVRKTLLEQQLRVEEAERWRRTAARVAIAALPVVGEAAGRGLFRAALGRGGGCGCLTATLVAALGLLAALL